MSRKTGHATATKPRPSRAEAFSPATLKVIGTYENTPAEEVRAVVERARAAQRVWAATDHRTRADHLLDARRYLIEHSEEVARVISSDNGKPHLEALLTEVFPVVDLIGYFAKAAGRLLADKPLSLHSPLLLNKRSLVRRDPLGVIGVIAPWNYPFTIPMGEIILGLLAGNGVVLKGSSVTPLVADMIGQVMAAAHLPTGLFSAVQGPGGEVGAALVGAGVDKISFTGSVDVGRQVMAMAAEHLTPVKLELGGKDPAIVCADANLERTAAGLVWAAFMNAGQTCASLERVYVVRDVADELIERVVEQTTRLRVGFDEGGGGFDMGPLAHEGQLRLVQAHVADAVAKGARVRAGGGRPEGLDPKTLPGYFHAPTVLTEVHHGMRCMTEETFGPTLPIMVVDSDEEALALANDSPFGLTASVWTSDRQRALQLAGRLRAGTVTVNDHNFTHGIPEAPWSGVGESGFGASHGEEGLMELTHPKHINEDRLPLAKNLWWFPYDGKLDWMLNSVLKLSGAADTARRFFGR